jgi:hypothetical protein
VPITNPYIEKEDALAKMFSINMDSYNKPKDRNYTALEMLHAYYDQILKEEQQASTVYLNETGGTKVDLCGHRFAFAEQLDAELNLELMKGNKSEIVTKQRRAKSPLLYTPSLAYWCEYHFGVYVAEWYASIEGALEDDTGVSWNDIMIRIYDGDTIGFLRRSDKRRTRPKTAHFVEINLWDRNAKLPNQQGEILLDLLNDSIAKPQLSIRKSVSLLKKSLQMLTGIWKDDPFEWLNDSRCWRVKFYMDDRRGDRDFRELSFEERKNQINDERECTSEWLETNRKIVT